MPFPLLFPLASFVAKATIGEMIATTVLTATTVNVANDAYQKIKESARSRDDDKQRNRN